MGNPNYGKEFENLVKQGFLKIPNVSIDRLHDQMTGYLGSKNICDFIVYKKPYEVYIECKTVHGNTLPFRNITDNQWNGLLEKSKIPGVFAGVICWWVDKDTTKYIPIQVLQALKETGDKGVRGWWKDDYIPVVEINGKKKRVFFDYDFSTFFDEVAKL